MSQSFLMAAAVLVGSLAAAIYYRYYQGNEAQKPHGPGSGGFPHPSFEPGYDTIRRRERRNDECSICLEALAKPGHTVTVLKCWHWFHTRCINLWLQESSLCPICRRRAHVHKRL